VWSWRLSFGSLVVRLSLVDSFEDFPRDALRLRRRQRADHRIGDIPGRVWRSPQSAIGALDLSLQAVLQAVVFFDEPKVRAFELCEGDSFGLAFGLGTAVEAFHLFNTVLG
jgi:hypothetical protein